MKFTLPLPVQFRDYDVLGHVNSTTYIQYMESARVALLHALTQGAPWYRPPIIVVAVRCEYQKAITAADRVEVDVWTSRIGARSWDLDYVVRDRDTRCVIGRTTQVAYDHAAQEMQTIGAALRQGLETYKEEALAFRGA